MGRGRAIARDARALVLTASDRHDLIEFARFARNSRRLSGSRVEKEITSIGEDGQAHRFHESVRIYSADELIGLMRRHGLIEARAWGTLSGDPLTESSRRMLLAARKEGRA